MVHNKLCVFSGFYVRKEGCQKNEDAMKKLIRGGGND
jgi:hypothetical protein